MKKYLLFVDLQHNWFNMLRSLQTSMFLVTCKPTPNYPDDLLLAHV